MRETETEKTTKRELIRCALEALKPADNPSTKWAMRRAIVWMAKTARDDLRDDNLILRNDLKDELKGIVSDIQVLQKRLRRPGVRKGLFLAVKGRNFDGEGDALERLGSKHLEMLPDALVRLSSDLLTLGFSAETTVYQLGLKGRKLLRWPPSIWRQ